MNLSRTLGTAAGLIAALALLGCAQSDAATGTVTLGFRDAIADETGDVTFKILNRAGSEVAESHTLGLGTTVAVAEVPFGWTTIEAVGVCSVEGELTAEHPTMSLIIDAEGCSLTD